MGNVEIKQELAKEVIRKLNEMKLFGFSDKVKLHNRLYYVSVSFRDLTVEYRNNLEEYKKKIIEIERELGELK